MQVVRVRHCRSRLLSSRARSVCPASMYRRDSMPSPAAEMPPGWPDAISKSSSVFLIFFCFRAIALDRNAAIFSFVKSSDSPLKSKELQVNSAKMRNSFFFTECLPQLLELWRRRPAFVEVDPFLCLCHSAMEQGKVNDTEAGTFVIPQSELASRQVGHQLDDDHRWSSP